MKKYKESINDYIGEEKLFNEELKGRILNRISQKKHKRRTIYMFKKSIPIVVMLLLIGGIGSIVYLISNNSEGISVTSPEENESVVMQQDNGVSNNTSDDTINQDQLRETLNLSLRIISAMINKDFDYLESVSDSSVTVNRENNSMTFGSLEPSYEFTLSDSFDYKNFEFRGYEESRDTIFIYLGVYNVSYEFEFTKSKSEVSNYSFKSLLTN